MKSGISIITIIPMRKDPGEQSEMISQILFGEGYRVLEEREKWLLIETRLDHYKGWIDRKMHFEVTYEIQDSGINVKPYVVNSKILEIELADGTDLTVVAGSSLPGLIPGSDKFLIGNMLFKIKGSWPEKKPVNITDTAKRFMNSPYLWGGRSPFGYDCSGFTQVVFKIHGITLPRDASQQALEGTLIPSLRLVKPGDLAFFTNEKGSVIHVGILISSSEIIHCSGRVKINRIDEKGIKEENLKNYSHNIFCIKRIPK